MDCMRATRARWLVVVTVGALARCSCEPEPLVDAGHIGEGPPVEEPDAGDPYTRDAGPVVCEEDANEDNDARDDATVVASGSATVGRYCGEDDDWYALDVDQGCNVLVELSFDASGGDLDLLLFDPDGQLIGNAGGLEDHEALNVAATATGRYAVRLRGGTRDDVGYIVTMSASCLQSLTCPADDDHEDNDDATTPAALIEGVSIDAIACGTDQDWYQVPVALGCIADARLSFVDAAGDVDIELRRADGTTVQGASRGVTDSERITKVVVEGGMSYRVYFGVADPENTYRLVVDEVCAVACPTDDPWEPNDARSGAPDLKAALDEVVGVVCADDDFFDTVPQTDCPMHVSLSFDDAYGDLDLELQDTAGAELASSRGTTNTEELDFTSTNGSRVVLRVFGFGGATATYRLRLESSCP
ncbi:MAG: hypothetical protein A2138_03980 [Deltaproteobacteria bacterium RBG_16_71_12]|nr:MAG: hypothetical protein A2138_03980 [Deltaproteobacteria bacterium RBG_16_71_12]